MKAYSNATVYSENVMDIRDINVTMTYNAVHACDRLCSRMKFFVLQTGTNVPDPIPTYHLILPSKISLLNITVLMNE